MRAKLWTTQDGNPVCLFCKFRIPQRHSPLPRRFYSGYNQYSSLDSGNTSGAQDRSLRRTHTGSASEGAPASESRSAPFIRRQTGSWRPSYKKPAGPPPWASLPPRPPPAVVHNPHHNIQAPTSDNVSHGRSSHGGRRAAALGSMEGSNGEWGLLVRRSPSTRRPPGRRHPEPLADLARSILEPPVKPPPLSMQDNGFWKPTIGTRVAPSDRPARFRDNSYKRQDSFIAKFGDRVGDKKSGERISPASDGWDWVDEERVQERAQERAQRRVQERGQYEPSPSPTVRPHQAKRGSSHWERPEKPKGRPKFGGSRRREVEDDGFDFDFAAEERAKNRRDRKDERKRQREAETKAQNTRPTPIFLPELISVSNLGLALGVPLKSFLAGMAELGFEEISADSILTGETAALVAQEYGFEPTVDTGESRDLKPRPPPEDPSTVPSRPPIVTIMGHVDHGKTTMLDWLRKSSVVAQEHGGITQHIGAFSVKLASGKAITFLDTPGHAAFLTMRQRGANVTDIVILVVAADDSVKPQTLEALKHARAAKVPIIVAINKIDKGDARVDQVKADLSRHGIEIEDYGGDVQVVAVSGKTGQGMDDLEENIVTLSEILDMRAEQDGMAEGWVLESSIKPIGRVATVLVKRGTLRLGDSIIAGTAVARIRSLRNEAGVELDEAGPGTAIEIMGWKDAPDAGDMMLQAPDEGKARSASGYRQDIREREQAAAEVARQAKMNREKAELEALQEEGLPNDEEKESGPTFVNFTVKGDVMGSVEAVCGAVVEIGNNEVRPRILRSAPGQITEFDVEHAAITNSTIVNFNNPIAGVMTRLAENSGVTILDHTVIYHLVDDIKNTLSKLLPPAITIKVVGEAEVLDIFPINVRGRVYKNIAGCRVRNGMVAHNSKYRVLRKGETIFDGTLESLKHGKKDVTEMRKGTECGMSFDGWQDMKQGDQIQAYEEIREERHL